MGATISTHRARSSIGHTNNWRNRKLKKTGKRHQWLALDMAQTASRAAPVANEELHIAFFNQLHPLHLVTILLVLISALLPGRVHALQPLLHLTYRSKRLFLALIADLPWLLLAVLSVAILLSLLRTSLHLELADFLWFKMTVLLLDREGEDVGELLTVSVHISFAYFHLDLSWNIIAILSRLS